MDPHEDEVDYDDEPPGAYLTSLEMGRGFMIWAVVDLLLIATLFAVGMIYREESFVPRADGAEVWLPIAVVWGILPVAAVGGVLATLFVHLNGQTVGDEQLRRGRIVLSMHFLSLLLWIAGRCAFAITFQIPTE